MTSVIIDPAKADEVTLGEGDIVEADSSPVKHSVTTENNARDITTSKQSTILFPTKRATGKDKEKCRSGNDINKWYLGILRLRPPLVTTKQPPLLSDQFSKLPKVSKSNHYICNLLQASTSRERPRLLL